MFRAATSRRRHLHDFYMNFHDITDPVLLILTNLDITLPDLMSR